MNNRPAHGPKRHSLLNKVAAYYGGKIKQFGAVPAGVDWNGAESQELRFEQLLKVRNVKERFSINDLGCGYGQLFTWLLTTGNDFSYRGFDVSDAMIEAARRSLGQRPNASFKVSGSIDTQADFTVASGIFNVKLDVTDTAWRELILSTLSNMDGFSTRGFAFNCLTKYSDPPLMRKDLYYADPCYLFDYCKTHFSKNVALLHDYGLFEFTIVVRK